jgi:predicted amidohydrolase
MLKMGSSSRSGVNRRRILQAVGTLAVAGGVVPAHADAAQNGVMTNAMMNLDRDIIRIAAVQSHANKITHNNLTAMLGAIDRLQNQQDKKDLIAFHASALHGMRPRNLDDAQHMAISLVGAEVAALSAKAKQHRVYVSFSALTTDAAWPGHVMARNILVGPDGDIVLAAWQATHDESFPFLTSVEGVLDRYVDLYGRDAVLPVVHTKIGNIALATDQAAPEIYRAYALKQAEIVIRSSCNTAARWDVQACAAYNRFYTVATASAVALHADSADALPALHGGGSLIVGPSGETLAEAGSSWDQTVTAQLPLAHYRQTHRPPDVHATLVMPIYTHHQDFI